MTQKVQDLDAILKKIQEEHKEQEEAAKFSDERFIYFKPGNKYIIRLCWPIDPAGKRDLPIIFKVTHEDSSNGQSKMEVTCPTSDYIHGRAGFKACKACAETSLLWNDWADNKNQTSHELYKNFKRQYRNTALTYVVSDSLNPKNDGTFKLFRVPHGVANYLRRMIFGWTVSKDEQPIAPSEMIGTDAFRLKDGVDLIIRVGQEQTKDGTFNQYTAEFARSKTTVPVTQDQVQTAAMELKFDEDFYTPFDEEATLKFVNERMLQAKLNSELLKITPQSKPDFHNPNISTAEPNENNKPEIPKSGLPPDDVQKLLADIESGNI
jgi:hypothetical protein